MLQGNTTNLPLQNIFQTLCLNQQEGILTVSYQKLERHVAIRKSGISLLCERTYTSRVLRDITSRLKLLNDSEYDNVFETGTGKIPPGDVLIDRRVIDPSDVGTIIREQILEHLYEIFEWRGASYRFEVQEIYADRLLFSQPEFFHALEFPVNAVLMEVARREDEWARIRELIPSAHQIYQLHEPPAALTEYASQVNLDPNRLMRLLEIVDGRRTVEAVVESSSVPAFFVFCALRALIQDNKATPIALQAKRALADELRQKFQLDKVPSLYRSILEEDPDDTDIRRKLVLQLERRKAPPEELLPHYRRLAQHAYGVGDLGQAEEYLKNILEHKPRDLDALEQLSLVHVRGRKDKVWSQTMREYVTQVRRSRQFERGARFLLGVAETEKTDAWLTQDAAHLFLLGGNLEEAAVHYEKSAKTYAGMQDFGRLEQVIEKLDVCDARAAQRWRRHLDGRVGTDRSGNGRLWALAASVIILFVVAFAIYEWDARTSYAEVMRTADQSVSRGDLIEARSIMKDFERSYRFSIVARDVQNQVQRLEALQRRLATDTSTPDTDHSDPTTADTDVERFRTRGTRLKSNGDYAGALKHYRSVDLNTLHPHVRGIIQKEIDDLEAYLSGARDQLVLALKAEKEGDIETANHLYRQLLLKYPKSAQIKKVRLPMLLDVLPPTATVKTQNEVLTGPPYVLKVPPGQDATVTVSAESFVDQSFSLNPELGYIAHIHLQKESRWSLKFPAYVEATPTGHSGNLYVGTRSGTVVCMDAKRGNEVWSFQLQGLGDCLGGIRHWRNGLVFAGTDRGLYYIDASTGQPILRLPLPGLTRAAVSPPDSEGRTYLVTTHGELVCADVDDARVMWTKHSGGTGNYPPLRVGNVVVVGTQSGYMTAFNPGTGETIWNKDFSEVLSAPPTVVKDTIILGTEDQRVIALRPADGTLLWTKQIAGPARGGFDAVGDDHLAVNTDTGHVMSIRLSDGETKWDVVDSGQYRSRPQSGNGLVFALDREGMLRAHGAEDGRLLWSYSIEAASSCPFTFADDTVYLVGENRWFHAISIPATKETE